MINIIVNPNAHKGKIKGLIARVEEKLRADGVEHRFFYSERAGGLRAYAKALSEAGEETIVAMGGDGSLNEVLCGLVDPSRIKLGLIPAGTGNDFAAAANIPEGLAAVDLLYGEAVPTDYLECDGIRSINIAGIGIDVDIIQRCERMKGGDKTKYFRSLLVSLRKYRGQKVLVTTDGETREFRALLACACNGKQMGGGLRVCPDSSLDDGLMDVVVIEYPKRVKLLTELICLLRGKILTRPISHRFKCKEAAILPETAGAAQYDGELKESACLTARLVHGGLRMFRG